MTDRRITISARTVGHVELDQRDALRLTGVRATGETYGPRTLKAFWSIGSRFESCSFEGLRIEDACFGSGRTKSLYVECRFDGSELRSPAVGAARFERCSFRGVRLSQWRSSAEFVDCVFSGSARDCIFHGLDEDLDTGEKHPVEFRGNDFSGMDLRDVEFRGGIDLREQRLPQRPGDLYLEDAVARLSRARERLHDGDDDCRAKALAIIDVLQEDVDVHRQHQVYANLSDLVRDPDLRQVLLDALEE